MCKIKDELLASVGGTDPDDFGGVNNLVIVGGKFSQLPWHKERVEYLLLSSLFNFLESGGSVYDHQEAKNVRTSRMTTQRVPSCRVKKWNRQVESYKKL